MKAKSPPTPEIDPRAVREALRFLQGTTDVDDDVVRKALMSIKVWNRFLVLVFK